METKHTPGPWSFRPLMSEDNRGMGYIEDANGHDIIHAGVMDLPMHENQANAALIAAAPDLLEALKMVKHLVPQLLLHKTRGGYEPNPSYEKVNAAIAKAEGR